MSGFPLDHIEKSEMLVERIRFAIRQAVSEESLDTRVLMQGTIPQFQIDHISQRLVVRLQKFLLENKAPVSVDTQSGSVSCFTPKTVWQFFKLKHLPAWFSRWFPVVMEERHHIYTKQYNTHVTRYCPHATLDWARHMSDHIEFLKAGREYCSASIQLRPSKGGLE